MPGRDFRTVSCAWRTAFRAATPSPTRSMRRTPGACIGRCCGLPKAGRPGLAAVGKVVPARRTGAGTTTGTRRRIMSAEFSPQRFRHAVRSCRTIGNPPQSGAGRDHERGSAAQPHRARTGKPRTAAPAGFKTSPAGAVKGRRARQSRAHRMGRQLPARHDPPPNHVTPSHKSKCDCPAGNRPSAADTPPCAPCLPDPGRLCLAQVGA